MNELSLNSIHRHQQRRSISAQLLFGRGDRCSPRSTSVYFPYVMKQARWNAALRAATAVQLDPTSPSAPARASRRPAAPVLPNHSSDSSFPKVLWPHWREERNRAVLDGFTGIRQPVKDPKVTNFKPGK